MSTQRSPTALALRAELRTTAWVARCAPGLASLLTAELRYQNLIHRGQRVDILRQRNHDLVFLGHLGHRPDERPAHIAEEWHRSPVYGRHKISKRQLDVVARVLQPGATGWKIAVTVDGRFFNRRDIARWLTKRLQERGVRIDETSQRLLWLFCIEDAYYFCLPALAAADLPHRKLRTVERQGSLPPTVAAAVAFAGHPKGSDAILDPVCGSGTLLAEAHAYAPSASFYGYDADPEAVAIAQRNLGHISGVRLWAGDASRTGLHSGSISLFLANLPFGRQFGTHEENVHLYPRLLNEVMRLGSRQGWRGVFLSADVEALQAALARLPTLRIQRSVHLKVRGQPATLITIAPHGNCLELPRRAGRSRDG
jgi:hypothetical protein